MTDLRHRTAQVNGVELQVMEAGDPTAPPIILAHGFPECAWSWRHQMAPLAAAGFHVIAPDQRGYGHSSRPYAIEEYGIRQLTGDLIGLLDETGHETGVFVGHDWGSLVTWEVARLYPERTRAVVGVSVPFTPWPGPPTQLLAAAFGDRFFYILYFQKVGPAEEEMEADVRATMHSMMWAASGAMYKGMPAELPPMEGTKMLGQMTDIPAELPAWLTADDLDLYVERFEASGFRGPINWYRNLDANYEVLKDIPPSRLTMPSFFIGGEKDLVTAANPDGIDDTCGLLPGYRGKVIVPEVGHWIQQEDPDAFNSALLGFLATL